MRAALQREFSMTLLSPEMSVPSTIRASGKTERDNRFAVHRNNFVVNLVDALQESFPVTVALVGTAFFREMARERILADPPRSPVLLEYAQGFSHWVANYDPAISLGYLSEVVMLEALRILAYNAKDHIPLEEKIFQQLASRPELLANTRVVLHPACHWMVARHAAFSIWMAHQNIDDMADADIEPIDVNQSECLIVSRPVLDVTVSKLPPGGIAFLNSLRAGDSIGEAFQQALLSDVEANPVALFSILIEHGTLVALDCQTELDHE
ncbi:MAG: DNA-binding domain-containing protein [Arenimonas sp.]